MEFFIKYNSEALEGKNQSATSMKKRAKLFPRAKREAEMKMV